ncbi:hypothetical protein GCM10010345_21720 [Streptomyces canarius]|uniref:DUF222 domain-containing protein n=2 Tax=Streptomyces TaxID=1883 RepID=A0ABQ3CJ21_9ACTN|nr:hypothetical protein GCM10010345_21720 [Streptomyces canarius]
MGAGRGRPVPGGRDGMSAEELTEDQALALWCDRLPSLQTRAARAGLASRLDRDIARVRDGGSAVRACRKWLPEDDEPGGRTTRSWSGETGTAFASLPGGREIRRTGVGAYACPTGACARRAGRDEQGHPPACAAFGTPMQAMG